MDLHISLLVSWEKNIKIYAKIAVYNKILIKFKLGVHRLKPRTVLTPPGQGKPHRTKINTIGMYWGRFQAPWARKTIF